MREIKFRAWDKKDNEMLYQKIDTGFNSFWGEVTYVNINKIFKKERYVPMQCTGLKDKNDKEIYEGDIVKNSFRENGLIKYIKKSAGFYLILFHTGYTEQIKLSKGWAEEIEVIGNKYEDGDFIECS